jgi:Recombination endonuclease VII
VTAAERWPTAAAWQAWRAELAPPDAWPDLSELTGPWPRRRREVLAEVQGGRCALCLVAGLTLEMDHDWSTGLARGMVCKSCNAMVGKHESALTDTYVDLVALYLANPPAGGARWIWDAFGSVGRGIVASWAPAERRRGMLPS